MNALFPLISQTLNLITANESLLGVEIELSKSEDRALRLKKNIEELNEYDFILLVCPPALNIITLNALAASDGALVPLQAEFYALEGLSQLLKTIKSISTTINNKLKLSGVVLTMFDKRNNLSSQVEEDVRNYLDKDVFLTKIPRNIRLSEAPSHGLAGTYAMTINAPAAKLILSLPENFQLRERLCYWLNNS